MDIFAQNKVKQKHTTIFEINDSRRQYEFRGESYIKPFLNFIESLGYEPMNKELRGSEYITIKGFDFYIDTSAASFMGRQAYTQKEAPRKPENRFVALRCDPESDNTLLRVIINKEMDVAKIKAKIDKAIKASEDREAEIADYHTTNKNNTERVGLHYISHEIIQDAIKYVLIQAKCIYFSFKDSRYRLTISTDGKLLAAGLDTGSLDSLDKVKKLTKQISHDTGIFEYVVSAILNHPPLPADLIQWADTMSNQYFYTETMSTRRYASDSE